MQAQKQSKMQEQADKYKTEFTILKTKIDNNVLFMNKANNKSYDATERIKWYNTINKIANDNIKDLESLLSNIYSNTLLNDIKVKSQSLIKECRERKINSCVNASEIEDELNGGSNMFIKNLIDNTSEIGNGEISYEEGLARARRAKQSLAESNGTSLNLSGKSGDNDIDKYNHESMSNDESMNYHNTKQSEQAQKLQAQNNINITKITNSLNLFNENISNINTLYNKYNVSKSMNDLQNLYPEIVLLKTNGNDILKLINDFQPDDKINNIKQFVETQLQQFNS
jgi:hypothetical protein